MELGIELPKWKYQDLAQEQEQRAAEVTPVAEKLLDKVEEYVNRQQRNITNLSLNPQTRQLFESLKDNLSQENNKTTLVGDNYKIIKNMERQTLTVSRTEEKTLLVKKNLSSNQIEVNRGLTDNDIQKWRKIDRLLPKDNRERQITPPQNDSGIEQ